LNLRKQQAASTSGGGDDDDGDDDDEDDDEDDDDDEEEEDDEDEQPAASQTNATEPIEVDDEEEDADAMDVDAQQPNQAQSAQQTSSIPQINSVLPMGQGQQQPAQQTQGMFAGGMAAVQQQAAPVNAGVLQRLMQACLMIHQRRNAVLMKDQASSHHMAKMQDKNLRLSLMKGEGNAVFL
jgi:uncharacterized protein YcfJ